MQLKNKSASSFVVFLKKPKFMVKSVLAGEEFVVDDQTGYAILSEYPEQIEKLEDALKAKAFARSPSDKSLEVKL
jgi:hypothetical protein